MYRALDLIPATYKPMGVVAHACYPSILEVGAGGPEDQGNLQLYIKCLLYTTHFWSRVKFLIFLRVGKLE